MVTLLADVAVLKVGQDHMLLANAARSGRDNRSDT
jgi:hypothetical protein